MTAILIIYFILEETSIYFLLLLHEKLLILAVQTVLYVEAVYKPPSSYQVTLKSNHWVS